MKHVKPYIVTLLCVGLLICSLCACGKNNQDNLPTPTEKGTVDLTDDRVLTPTDTIDARLDAAFRDTPLTPASDLTYIVADGGVTITGYIGSDILLNIPDTVEGMPVVAVAEGAFKGMSQLRAVSLPATVRSVGFGAFGACTGLATLRTPVFVCGESDWFGALFGALSAEINASAVPASLTTLILTGGTEIPDGCFYDCHNIEVVSLPEGLTSVGAFAFYGCAALVAANLPADVETVGEFAFANCTALLGQTFGEGVVSIGYAALEGCGALETLTVPFVGGKADENTFLGYIFGAQSHTLTEGFIPASLIRVTVREGCTAIPDNAFFECSSIREIRLPASVRTIGGRAFYRCARLASIDLPAGVTLGADAFHSCIRLTAVDLSGVAALSAESGCTQAFMDCRSLTAVTLPAGTVTLPNSFFAGCTALETVSGVNSLPTGNRVFDGCDKLPGETAVTD